jgi:hypothetical protein
VSEWRLCHRCLPARGEAEFGHDAQQCSGEGAFIMMLLMRLLLLYGLC